MLQRGASPLTPWLAFTLSVVGPFTTYDRPALTEREWPIVESTAPRSVLKPPLTPERSVSDTPALASPQPLLPENADCITTSVSERPAPRWTHRRSAGENPRPALAENPTLPAPKPVAVSPSGSDRPRAKATPGLHAALKPCSSVASRGRSTTPLRP